MPPNAESPVFGPTKRLDFELEMGFITTDGKALGESISIEETKDYIFGMVVFNDWSARDIQKWEYVPLGPFLAKNFASSMSPWVVTMDALQPFALPEDEPDQAQVRALRHCGRQVRRLRASRRVRHILLYAPV